MGGSDKKTSTTTSEPWQPAQAPLKGILSDAQNLYNSGVGPTPFGSRIADQSAASGDALNIAEADARAGMSPLVSSGMDWAKQQFASNGVNPYVEQVISNTQNDAANAVSARMSGMGRYGSGAHQGVISDTVGKIGAATRMDAFNQQQQLNQGLLSQMPMLEEMRQAPANRLSEIGGIRDQRSQQVLDDKAMQQEEQWSTPWQKLGLLANTVVPIAGLGGTQTNITTGSGPSGLQKAFGIGSSVLGGLGSFSKMGGLAGLAGMFALSDERSKTDISEPIAHTKDGIPIREYRYKDGGPPHIGMLAQEVAEKRPEAVAKHPSGFLMVNYKKAVG